MEDWADVRIESSPKGSKVDDPSGDDKIADVFAEATESPLAPGPLT